MMSKRPIPVLLPVVLALAALVLALGPAAAQKATAGKADPKAGAKAGSTEREDGFGESVNVNVVNVDVYVTDKDGKRISGLTKDDFEITENGKAVAITNFYAVEAGRALAVDDEPSAAPATAPAPPGEARPAPLPEDQRLKLIVYIDNFNLRPFNRNRVMRELRVFLGKNLSKGDQMMLVTYDRSTHVRQAFTSDPDLINSALLSLEKISAQGVHSDSERRDTLSKIEDARSAAEAEGFARSYAESAFNDLSFSIDSLKDLVNSLAGMPGRKAILYVSDGLQMIAGQDVFYAVQQKYGEQTSSLTSTMQYDASRRFNELAASANANRVTFYTIDAAGLRVYSSISAENQTAGQGVYIDSVQISNLQAPLQMLAEKTGGVAIINRNIVLPALEKVAEDFGSYYALGYSPPHYGDGRYYKIDVKVKRKGLTVRHREGYRDKSPDSRMTDSTMAVLNFPFEDNKFGIDMEFGAASPREDGFYLVPIIVKIPLSKVTLVPREQTATEEAQVRLYIAAMDNKGGISDVQQVPVPISIPKAEVQVAMTKYFSYSVSLLMRAGDQKIAVGVRDDVAGQSSFISRMLRVGSAAGR